MSPVSYHVAAITSPPPQICGSLYEPLNIYHLITPSPCVLLRKIHFTIGNLRSVMVMVMVMVNQSNENANSARFLYIFWPTLNILFFE